MPTSIAYPLRLCGGKLLVAVTRERRYGPSRLRVNDDDEDDDRIQAAVILTKGLLSKYAKIIISQNLALNKITRGPDLF